MAVAAKWANTIATTSFRHWHEDTTCEEVMPDCDIQAPTSVAYGSTGNEASTTCTPGATFVWDLRVDDVPRFDLITAGPGTCGITWNAPPAPWNLIKIGVQVTSAGGCACINDPVVSGEGVTVTGTNPPVPTLSQWGGAAFILLLAAGASLAPRS